jgi:type III pantothenate kinase
LGEDRQVTMLACIDIGNTNIKIGLFEGQEMRHHWRIATNRASLADEYAMLLLSLFQADGVDRDAVTGCVISSVVPVLAQEFEELSRRHLRQNPLTIRPGVKTGLPVHTDYPSEVGMDLIANAVAAKVLVGAPAIVVGLGTATTVSAVSADGCFEGVAIAPGMTTGAEALFRFAASLPQVALVPPPRAIGKNTIHSMQSGLVWGFAGLVKELVGRVQAELGGQARVIATGGLAGLIANEVAAIETVEPNLTLIGLRLIYEMNAV